MATWPEVASSSGLPIIAVKSESASVDRPWTTEEEDGAVDLGLVEAGHRAEVSLRMLERPAFEDSKNSGSRRSSGRSFFSSRSASFRRFSEPILTNPNVSNRKRVVAPPPSRHPIRRRSKVSQASAAPGGGGPHAVVSSPSTHT